MALGRPRPVPEPYVDEDDLLELAAEFGACHVPAADLYLRYNQMAVAAGRVPVPKRKFGVALNEAEWKVEIKYLDGATRYCRLITKSWARRAYEKHGIDPESVAARIGYAVKKGRGEIRGDFASPDELSGLDRPDPEPEDPDHYTWNGES